MNNKPLRVAQVVGQVRLAGVDTVVMNYYRNIDRSKVQFDFIMDGYDRTPVDDEIKAMGGRVFKVEPYASNLRKSLQQYYKIFKDNHYQIVHSHMNSLSVFPLFEAWRAGIPIRISHNHSTSSKGEGKKTLLKYILRPFAKVFPTHYCACSAFAGEWLFGKHFYNRGNVRLIHNAIDIPNFSFSQNIRDTMRKELGVEDKLVVGHVGRFVYQKNHQYLIDVFNEIFKQNSNSILLLVGDGPLKPEIQEKAVRMGIAKSVHFLGIRKDVSRLMQAMDIFVFPSNYEGLGMVAIEAQAAGLPTIVSEEIPKEAQVTSSFSYCHLSQSPKQWARTAFSCINGFQRTKTDKQISDAGFDIQREASRLLNYYMSVSNSIGRSKS